MIIVIKKFLFEITGQGLMEYSLIFALIALIVISALELLGIHILSFFNTLLTNGL